MTNKTTIVVLAKYLDIFTRFRETVDRYAPGIPRVLVRDGQCIPPPPGWEVVQGPSVFSMAGNANLGWRAAPPDHDLFYSGDDVRLLQDETVETLRMAAHADPEVGILSPQIIGGVNNGLQAHPTAPLCYAEERPLAFVCVYIKRAVIDAIGYLDERFAGYGFDDDDYCRRARRAGFRLGVTNLVAVAHEHANATFRRNHGGDPVPVWAQMEHNRRLFEEKWQRIERMEATP